MTIDLYTPADVKKARELLLKEQQGKCLIIGEIPKDRTFVLDHEHDLEQYVRGVLEREVNSYTGVLENAYKRHLAYWLPTPLPDVLRAVAAYLERPKDTRYRHTGWIKKVTVLFNKLTASQQNQVLLELGLLSGSNPATRKKLFKEAVLDRNLGYNTIRSTIEKSKLKP